MNQEILICYLVITFSLMLRMKLDGFVPFLHTLLSCFTLITFGPLIFLVYDVWLTKKLTNEQVKNTVDRTFEDINNLTTLHKQSDIDKPKFPEDSNEDKRNKNLIRDSLLTGIVGGLVVIGVLYKLDKHFYNSLYSTLISIVVIYVIELYFSWAIISDFEGDGLDEIRHVIVSGFQNI